MMQYRERWKFFWRLMTWKWVETSWEQSPHDETVRITFTRDRP